MWELLEFELEQENSEKSKVVQILVSLHGKRQRVLYNNQNCDESKAFHNVKDIWWRVMLVGEG